MRVVVIGYVILSLQICGFAQCQVPDYRQGATLADSKSEIITNVSIGLQDFTPNRLICLARNLKDRYRGRDRIMIGIFSSQSAAMYLLWQGLPPEPGPQDYEALRQMHGSYVYRKDIHDDYVLLRPDPMIDNPAALSNTKINLSTPTIPPCKLQINNRCLLAFDHIVVPIDAEPGAATLTAEIDRAGSVVDVHVTDADKNGSEARQALATFASQNLKSWHFESSQSKEHIRITYSLERMENGVYVQFMLPDRVTIQTGP
jgi:hypothetical protein